MEQISSISRMIKRRISISPCEVKQLNAAPCDARQACDDRALHNIFSHLFIYFVLISMRFSISVYLKTYRKQHTLSSPRADISWEAEFMGTRRSFPTPVPFSVSLHSLLNSFSLLIILSPHLCQHNHRHRFLRSSDFLTLFP